MHSKIKYLQLYFSNQQYFHDFFNHFPLKNFNDDILYSQYEIFRICFIPRLYQLRIQIIEEFQKLIFFQKNYEKTLYYSKSLTKL